MRSVASFATRQAAKVPRGTRLARTAARKRYPDTEISPLAKDALLHTPPAPRTGRDLAPLQRLRALSRVLDDSIPIPGTGRRIGLDALIGLVPGIGDAAGALLSAYVLLEAARMGISRATLLRMAANVGVELVVGAIPLVGDLFDAGWKANQRNVRLLERHLASPERATRASRSWLLAVALGLALLLVVMGAVAVWLAAAVLRALT